MKKFKFILGVDVSKGWLNFCLRNEKLEIIGEWKIDNTVKEILKFLTGLVETYQLEDWLVLMEHTGIYVQHLVESCLQLGIAVSLEVASKISQHLGGKVSFEEKNDPMDARRISEYGIRFQDKLSLWQAKPVVLIKLKRLQAQRVRLMKIIHQLEVPLKESKKFDDKDIYEMQHNLQKQAVKELKKSLKQLEQTMNQLIKEDERLKELFKIITSVEGVGKVIAREMILTTSGFTTFNPTQGKSFSRYAGVVPTSKQSGKKNGRAKVSKRGNKRLKSILTMGAISLIGTNNELGKYYERKIKEGKEHLCVVNAMRNKMILRIFAVVRKKVMYEKNLNVSLD